MTKEQLIKEFDDRFSFHKGGVWMDGETYMVPYEIKAFLLSAFDSGRASGIEEVKDIKKLLEVAKCPDVDCDNKGSITCRISDDEWEQQQCQWCDEKRIALTPSSSKDN